jgi:hypothetical protein
MQAERLHKWSGIVSAIPMIEPVTMAAKSRSWGWFCFPGYGVPEERSKLAEYGINGGDRRHFS